MGKNNIKNKTKQKGYKTSRTEAIKREIRAENHHDKDWITKESSVDVKF